MADINSCLATFARLPQEERERSLKLIGAYNDAVAEHRTGVSGPVRLFNPDEIERLVRDYRGDRLSNIRPAMIRYLLLLDRGYRLPVLG